MPISFRHLVQTASRSLSEADRRKQAQQQAESAAARQAAEDRRREERDKSILARQLQETEEGRARGERAERGLAETARHNRALEAQARRAGTARAGTADEDPLNPLYRERAAALDEIRSLGANPLLDPTGERSGALRRRIAEVERRIAEETGFRTPEVPLPVAAPIRVPPPAGRRGATAPSPPGPTSQAPDRESLIQEAIAAGDTREEAEDDVDEFLRLYSSGR